VERSWTILGEDMVWVKGGSGRSDLGDSLDRDKN